jgi:hypothetical protein
MVYVRCCEINNFLNFWFTVIGGKGKALNYYYYYYYCCYFYHNLLHLFSLYN